MVLREYRKTATIKAEVFDGSFEMMERYPIQYAPFLSEIAPPNYSLMTLEGYIKLEVGDYIATGIDGEHWVIKGEIFDKTYELIENQYGVNRNDDERNHQRYPAI
ncbi:hypothetical protein [Lactobacillus taiwanensis]|uniref:hypothetical protein n=1 Tax=Lactobacillus taiwanensis TaxID=508451 RepID=UPI0025AA0962|nr:hypothetical protein [Lactobacillus taiwanensis]